MKKTWLAPAWRNIAQRLEQQKLSHALLLNGEPGIGKTSLANYALQTLLCHTSISKACGHCHSCQLFMANNHPGLYRLKAEQGNVKVDQIRSLTRWANETATIGSNKVVLIEDLALLNEACSNALLKTLEEPSASTYFILINHRPHQVMATIRSRCQQFEVHSPNQQQLHNWLHAKQIRTGAEFMLLYRLCHGSVTAIEQCYQDLSLLDTFIQQLNQLSEGNALSFSEYLSKNSAQLIWLGEVLNILVQLQQAILNPADFPQLNSVINRWTKPQLLSTYQQWLHLQSELTAHPSLNLSMQLYPLLQLLNVKEPAC